MTKNKDDNDKWNFSQGHNFWEPPIAKSNQFQIKIVGPGTTAILFDGKESGIISVIRVYPKDFVSRAISWPDKSSKIYWVLYRSTLAQMAERVLAGILGFAVRIPPRIQRYVLH